MHISLFPGRDVVIVTVCVHLFLNWPMCNNYDVQAPASSFYGRKGGQLVA